MVRGIDGKRHTNKIKEEDKGCGERKSKIEP